MAGETDLTQILQTLEIERRPGSFGYVSLDGAIPPGVRPVATIAEAEGLTVIAAVEELEVAGLPPTFVAAWLTVTVHSSLEAVGLTAELARRLAAAGIPANVLAGAFHDHVLVPVDDADRAITALRAATPI